MDMMLQKTAAPIVDPEVLSTLRSLPFHTFFPGTTPRTLDMKIRREFLVVYENWIAASEINKIRGLHTFPFRRLISGTTQSFDDFFIRHRWRKIKVFKGEFSYAKWTLEDVGAAEHLEEGDAVLISTPFSATGEQRHDLYHVFERCEELNIPVLIDCAFFGICTGLDLDLNFPCIERVCFSLSKIFSSGCFRSGIEFCRHNAGAIGVQNEWDYVQLLSAKIGLELMQRFPPDYIVNKYSSRQKEVCTELSLTPSKTIIFGLGNEKYDDFSVDDVANRVCISELLSE